MKKNELIVFFWIFFFSLSFSFYQTKNDIGGLILFFIFFGYYLYTKYKKSASNNLNNSSHNGKSKESFLIKKVIDQKQKLPYVKKQYLLTKNELKFYHFLNDVIADKYVVMCSVRVIDIIKPLNKNDFTSKAKIIQKHIDFLICNKGYLNPILAIELNDGSHRDYNRYERDNFLDLAFQSAGLPLIFVSTRDMSRKDYIRSILSEFIELK